MDNTFEQTALPAPARSAAHTRIRIATISLNLLAAVLGLLVSTIGIALTLGMPDVQIPNDDSEIYGLFSATAIFGVVGLFYALPLVLGMNILSWVFSAVGRSSVQKPSTGPEACTETADLPHT